MSADSILKQVFGKFWAKNNLISFWSNRKGLHYAMKGYIQNFKTRTAGDKLKFSWYSGLPHSLIHITHFTLCRCGLWKMNGWNVPHSSASWDTHCPCYMHPKHIIWPCFFKQHKSNRPSLFQHGVFVTVWYWSMPRSLSLHQVLPS